MTPLWHIVSLRLHNTRLREEGELCRAFNVVDEVEVDGAMMQKSAGFRGGRPLFRCLTISIIGLGFSCCSDLSLNKPP